MKKLAFGFVILAIVGGVVWSIRPTDERIIQKRLAALAQTLSVSPGESHLAKLANVNKAIDFFSPEVTFQIENLDWPLHDRNDLREVVLASRARVNKADIEFHDIHLKFPEERNLAVAYAMALVRWDNQTNTAVREVKMTLKKTEGRWLISRVESIGAGLY